MKSPSFTLTYPVEVIEIFLLKFGSHIFIVSSPIFIYFLYFAINLFLHILSEVISIISLSGCTIVRLNLCSEMRHRQS